MAAVIGTNKKWHTGKSRKVIIGRTRTWLPPLGTRIRVSVERRDNNCAGRNWRRAQIQARWSARGSAAYRQAAIILIYVDPAALVVPLGWILRV